MIRAIFLLFSTLKKIKAPAMVITTRTIEIGLVQPMSAPKVIKTFNAIMMTMKIAKPV
ncbi:hypothetical protein D3C78_1932080 [compost metagenome]